MNYRQLLKIKDNLSFGIFQKEPINYFLGYRLRVASCEFDELTMGGEFLEIDFP